MLDILAVEPIPMRAPGVVGQVYREIVEKHKEETLPRRYWTPNGGLKGYTEIWALKNLRPDGGAAAVRLDYLEDQGTRTMDLSLFHNWSRNTSLSGKIRLIRGTCELKLLEGDTKLRQQIVVDPKQDGMSLLDCPAKLLDLAEWMVARVREISNGFPEFFEPPADIKFL